MGDVVDIVSMTSSSGGTLQSDAPLLLKRIVCYSIGEVNVTSEQFVMEAFIIDGW